MFFVIYADAAITDLRAIPLLPYARPRRTERLSTFHIDFHRFALTLITITDAVRYGAEARCCRGCFFMPASSDADILMPAADAQRNARDGRKPQASGAVFALMLFIFHVHPHASFRYGLPELCYYFHQRVFAPRVGFHTCSMARRFVTLTLHAFAHLPSDATPASFRRLTSRRHETYAANAAIIPRRPPSQKKTSRSSLIQAEKSERGRVPHHDAAPSVCNPFTPADETRAGAMITRDAAAKRATPIFAYARRAQRGAVTSCAQRGDEYAVEISMLPR